MNNNFSENLKKIRKDNNLSQEQLAFELGVSRQAISKWESAIAYPEMDKIIAISEKFNLNIDDLLHKDIREIKGEEESKKNLNKYIDDFLNFITDTINMFSSMSFKSKIKCLFEQIIIISVLFIIFSLIGATSRDLLLNLLELLPGKLLFVTNSLVKIIYTIFSFTVSLIIILHIFKTRYLNYFIKLKKETNEEKDKIKKETNEETIDNSTNKIDKKNKYEFNDNDNKIIIRDPKHSEYKFINGIFKLMVGIIKFFALCFSAILFFILITLIFFFVISFLISKTGLFFIGLLILSASLAIIDINCILVVLNFIFNRKNDKKKIIWSVIISLILVGVGSGLISIGLLNFKYVENDQEFIKTDYVEIEMQDDLVFETYNFLNEIEYVESNDTNIKIEYKINKYFEINNIYDNYRTNIIHLGIRCSDPIKIINQVIKNLNAKKIVSIGNNFETIKIYTTRENINKLKGNKNLYYENLTSRENLINYYEKQIDELQQKNFEYSEKIREYEHGISFKNNEY